MSKDFFPPKPDVKPTIYAYELVGVDSHKGLLKVGYTVRSAEERVKEQSNKTNYYRIVLIEDATETTHNFYRSRSASSFEKKYIKKDGEWFKCSLKDVSLQSMILEREN